MANPVDLADRPVPLQGVPAPGYSAIDLRRHASGPLDQEGVLGATGAFKVSPGAGRTVSVAAGEAAVQGDSVVNQGRYYQRSGGAVVVDVDVAHATLPRIDQLVLEVKDDAADGSGLNVARLRCIAGTPTSGATIANRTGAAALPNTAVRLADILVPAAFAGPFVANTHIRDRRPWAQGAWKKLQGSGNGTDYTAPASRAPIDSTNLGVRLELSGAPVEVVGFAAAYSTVANDEVQLTCVREGAEMYPVCRCGLSPANLMVPTMFQVLITGHAPGSHFLTFDHHRSAGTGTVKLQNAFFFFPEIHFREVAGGTVNADNSAGA